MYAGRQGADDERGKEGGPKNKMSAYKDVEDKMEHAMSLSPSSDSGCLHLFALKLHVDGVARGFPAGGTQVTAPASAGACRSPSSPSSPFFAAGCAAGGAVLGAFLGSASVGTTLGVGVDAVPLWQ